MQVRGFVDEIAARWQTETGKSSHLQLLKLLLLSLGVVVVVVLIIPIVTAAACSRQQRSVKADTDTLAKCDYYFNSPLAPLFPPTARAERRNGTADRARYGWIQQGVARTKIWGG